MGCRASDHALSYVPCVASNSRELEQIFKKGVDGKPLSELELDKYKTALLGFLGENYAEKGWVMELHIGALRNNNTKMFQKLGADTGFDSVDDREIAAGLSRFLDSLAKLGKLPKTVLFTLNPKDNVVLGTMLGVLSRFVGMITDSRSFLSYPRHEYFRRILCELIGEWVEEGKYPEDIKFLSQVVEDISFNNAKNYFGLKI